MSLSKFNVAAIIPVSDTARAKEFYEGKLGLEGGFEPGEPGKTTYPCAGTSEIHVNLSPVGVGGSGATQAGWEVEDIDAVVDELAAAGVAFEAYDTDPIHTNEKGIAVLFGNTRAAWFRDPDGNMLAVAQQR